MTKAERTAYLEDIKQIQLFAFEWKVEAREAQIRGDVATAKRCRKQMLETVRLQRELEQEAYRAGLGKRAISQATGREFIPAQ